MISNKYITVIISVIMALAVLACLFASIFSGQLSAIVSDSKGVTMEYESKLFDTSQIMSVNIIIDEDDWNKMLDNAISEEYYSCDVEINGTTFKNVGIRPKGNTSLSSIANNPDTDRYSFKLEFDHYVEGQTCFGLDKLILNNNYSDATMIKEALIYDMYQYIGADASLYNFAKISVNGDYWGVYLALEAVEDSFLIRNYGAQDGELYKPEGMDMGGGGPKADGNDGNHDGNPPGNDDNKPAFDGNKSDTDGNKHPNFEERSDFAGSDSEGTSKDEVENIEARPEFSKVSDSPDIDNKSKNVDSDSVMGDVSKLENIDPDSSNLSNTENDAVETEPTLGNVLENSEKTPQNGVNSSVDNSVDGSESRGFGQNFDAHGGPDGSLGGFGNGQNGANLNYSDDELNSYSTIWDGEVTKTTDSDHERVVTALKSISEGTNLEDYMNIDNLLKYAAVHIFSVNDDSLSGAMAHNYYLYESNGKLNLIPWDYNLAFGGMNGGDASGVINSAIDDAFSSTDFFDALLDNDEYHEQYYLYLQKLVEGYINNGGFDAFYNRVRSQVDDLVKDDPTAFYTYNEYDEAANTLYETVKLRGESILGQINGTIPSTEEEQKDSDALIDASDIDISVMGQMHNGGNDNGRPEGEPSEWPGKRISKSDSDDVET